MFNFRCLDELFQVTQIFVRGLLQGRIIWHFTFALSKALDHMEHEVGEMAPLEHSECSLDLIYCFRLVPADSESDVRCDKLH